MRQNEAATGARNQAPRPESNSAENTQRATKPKQPPDFNGLDRVEFRNRWTWRANLLVLFGLLATAVGYALCEAHRNQFVGKIFPLGDRQPYYIAPMEIDPAPRARRPLATASAAPAIEVISREVNLLNGGNVERGKKIFFEKTEALCRNCHRVDSQGGNVGPDLSRIGTDRTREELLESLLDPDKTVAAGFNTLLVQTIDGEFKFGVVREDGPDQVRIVDIEAKEHLIPVNDIVDRRPGRSAMPANLKDNLSPQELCDLIEYLASLKGH